MTVLLPATLVEAVERTDGSGLHVAVPTVRHITRLACGCHRFSCNRPGGGVVDVLRGEHCQPVEIPSSVRANPPPLAVPA